MGNLDHPSSLQGRDTGEGLTIRPVQGTLALRRTWEDRNIVNDNQNIHMADLEELIEGPIHTKLRSAA